MRVTCPHCTASFSILIGRRRPSDASRLRLLSVSDLLEEAAEALEGLYKYRPELVLELEERAARLR